MSDPPAINVNTSNTMTGLINKLETFSGSSTGMKVETFLFCVDEISRIGKWSPEDTASAVRISLKGEAQEFVLMNKDLRDTKTWDILRKALLDRYKAPDVAGWNNVQFSQCIQKTGESVANYADRLKRAGTKLLKACDSEEERKLREEIHGERLLTQFLDGLVLEIRRPVLHKSPENFTKAVEAAKLAETVELQLATMSLGRSRSNDRVCQVNTSVTQTFRDQVPATKIPGRFSNKERRPRGREKIDMGEIMCFNCEELGHFSRYCPAKRSPDNSRPVFCKRCEKPGHKISACKEKSSNLNSKQPATNAQVVAATLPSQ